MRYLNLYILAISAGLFSSCRGTSSADATGQTGGHFIDSNQTAIAADSLPKSWLELDWNEDGILDTIRLMDPENDGRFEKLEIRLSGFPRKEFDYEGGEVATFIPDWPSNKLYDLQRLLPGEKQFLFLYGPDQPLFNQILYVFYPGKTGAEQIYELPFEITEMKDLDSDGSLELIGSSGYNDWGDKTGIFTAVNPAEVLKVKKEEGQVKLVPDKKLADFYNVNIQHFPEAALDSFAIRYKPHPDSTGRYLTPAEFKVLYKKHYPNGGFLEPKL